MQVEVCVVLVFFNFVETVRFFLPSVQSCPILRDCLAISKQDFSELVTIASFLGLCA